MRSGLARRAEEALPRSQICRRIRRAIGHSTLALAVLLAVDGCKGRPQWTAQQAQGRRLYAGRCAHCHEDNDLALKKIPPDLHHVFRASTLPSGAPATDAEVRRVILAGKGMMPSFAGRFDDEQLAALMAYLHTGLR